MRFDPSPRSLALVAFLALALAVAGALRVEDPDASAAETATGPGEGLVRVGSRTLTVEDLRRAVEGQSGLRRGDVKASELRELLDALVDEELLVQRAEALGLVDTDPTLRRALQTAMKEQVASTAPMPSEEELRRLYAAGDDAKREQGERDFEQVRTQVLRDQQRRARVEALDEALQDLRARTEITYSDPAGSAVGESSP